MELVSIALICVFIIQVVCYWVTYRTVQQLTIAVKSSNMQKIVYNLFSTTVMLLISLSSIFMLLSFRYVHLIMITCGLALLVLVTVANFISEGGEDTHVE